MHCAGLKAVGQELVEKTSYKRGATDFSSQVAKLKSSGCDLVVMGTIIRETIGTIAESRKTGFTPTFFGSSACYTDLIHKLGGKAMDGLYATMTVANPYTHDETGSDTCRNAKAMKRTMATMTKAMAKTFGPMGVRANCVGPGPIDTAWTHKETGPMTADELRRAVEEPAKRGGWRVEEEFVHAIRGNEPVTL